MKKFLCFIFITATVLILSGFSVSAVKDIFSASPDGALSIHISPDEDSYCVAVAPSCAKLTLVKKNGIWGIISFNNKTGWVNLSYTRDSYELAAEATGKNSVRNVITKKEQQKTELYTLPSTDEKTGSEAKYSVPAETVLKIVRETDSGWGLVSLSDDYMWIQLDKVSAYKTKTEEQISNFGIYYVYTLSRSKNGTPLYSKASGGIVFRHIPD